MEGGRQKDMLSLVLYILSVKYFGNDHCPYLPSHTTICVLSVQRETIVSCSGREGRPRSIWMRAVSPEGRSHSPNQSSSGEASLEIGTVVLESGP